MTLDELQALADAATLDGVFGPRTDKAPTVTPRMEGPGGWRSRHNPDTRAVARDLQQDTPLPLVGEGANILFGAAGKLLVEFAGDVELIHRALEKCRENGKWRIAAEESIYKVLPSVVQAAYGLRKSDDEDTPEGRRRKYGACELCGLGANTHEEDCPNA